MTPKEKAEELVDSYRIVLMNKDTQCGEEILCTEIAKQLAIIAVDEVLDKDGYNNYFWNEVKHELEKL
jgi:hypothetical protein